MGLFSRKTKIDPIDQEIAAEARREIDKLDRTMAEYRHIKTSPGTAARDLVGLQHQKDMWADQLAWAEGTGKYKR